MGSRCWGSITGRLAILAVACAAFAALPAGAQAARTTSLVSAATGVPDPNTDQATFEGSSADGSVVFFESQQPLTADDTDATENDVYMRSGGVTTLVSKPTMGSGSTAFGSDFKGASADGSRVFFSTQEAMTADDTDGTLNDVFMRSGGVTTLVSAPTGLADPNFDHVGFVGASADGSHVFLSTAQKMTTDDLDSNLVDIYDRSGGITTLVSAPTGVADPNSNSVSFAGTAADGSRVFFETRQKLTADDTDTNRTDVYERSAGTTTLVTKPTGVADPDTNDAFFAASRAGGTRVFFVTSQKLTADDTDSGRDDVYERSAGTTTLISQPTGVADPDDNGVGFDAASASGDRVFFVTFQKMTADDNDANRLDTYERASGTTTLITAPTGVADPDSGDAEVDGISDDGTKAFFQTPQKLTADDTDANRWDVYERSGGTTKLASAPTAVPDPNTDDAFWDANSADGNRVVFDTNQKLTADDTDMSRSDLYERSGGTTSLVSGPTGVPDPNSNDTEFAGATADATHVFFNSFEKLVPEDLDSNRLDAYVSIDNPPVTPPPVVDKTPPQTTITRAPKKKSFKRKAKLEFSSSEAGSTFMCKLDKKRAKPCTSPLKTKKLKPGRHRFEVDATDAAGNADPTPAVAKWKVKRH